MSSKRAPTEHPPGQRPEKSIAGRHAPDPENCECCWWSFWDGSLQDVVETDHITNDRDEVSKLREENERLRAVYEAANNLRPIGSPVPILRMQTLEDALRRVREAS